MFGKQKIQPHECILVEYHVSQQFRLFGPGPMRVYIAPWMRQRANFSTAPQAEFVEFTVRTSQDNQVNLVTHVLYQADPTLMSVELLPKVPNLATGGWASIIRLRLEPLIRRQCATYTQVQLSQGEYQEELEKYLTKKLAIKVNPMGINLLGITFVRVELEEGLQRAINRSQQVQEKASAEAQERVTQAKAEAECFSIEVSKRASLLQAYMQLFGNNIDALPHIIEWERLQVIRDNPNIKQLIISGQSTKSLEQTNGISDPTLPLVLPLSNSEAQDLVTDS